MSPPSWSGERLVWQAQILSADFRHHTREAQNYVADLSHAIAKQRGNQRHTLLSANPGRAMAKVNIDLLAAEKSNGNDLLVWHTE
jgi:hypothetical protein